MLAFRAGDGYTSGVITNETTGRTYQAMPFSPFVKAIIEKGGLVESVNDKLGA